MDEKIFEPTDEHRDSSAEDQMKMGKAENALHDPWFPSAEAAEAFPEGQNVPEGVSYEEWKAGQD